MVEDDRYFGYTRDAWEAMVDAGHAYLTELAAREADTDYTTFCQEVKRRSGHTVEPGDHALAYVLGAIGTRTFEEKGVVVTVVVHYKGGSDPGPGFFGLCQELGILDKGALGEDTKLAFFAQHTRAVFDAYRRPRRG
jgi:hypothetical protein